jgi:hypothetical protein
MFTQTFFETYRETVSALSQATPQRKSNTNFFPLLTLRRGAFA